MWKKLFITSPYHNNRAQNVILEVGYIFYAHSVFLPKSTFYKFFSEEATKDQ